jgi:hypothetical protein
MLVMQNGSTALAEITRLFAGTDDENDEGVELLSQAVLAIPRCEGEMIVSLGLLQFLTRTGGLPDEGRTEMVGWAVELYRRAKENGEPIRCEDLTMLRNIHAAAVPFDWHLATLAASLLTACKPRLISNPFTE